MAKRVPLLRRFAVLLSVVLAVGWFWLGLHKRTATPKKRHEAAAAAKPVGVVRSQPGREAETKS